MKFSLWYSIRFAVLLVLVLLIALSSHPIIVNMSRAAGMDSGTILSKYIIVIFIGLFIMCLNIKSMMKPKLVRICWLVWFLIVIFYLITFSVFGKKSMMNEIRSIAICLVAIMIGWQLNLNKKRLYIVLITFAGLILFVGLMQVFMNVGGFVILDQYHTNNKNSLGVMLATGGIAFVFMGLNCNTKNLPKLVFFALAILSLIVLLTIRARAAVLTSGIMLLYILYERYKGKSFFYYLFFGIIAVLIVYFLLPASLKQFVYNSFFQNYEEGDITGGRTARNIAALSFLSDHLLFGNLDNTGSVGWIHNYPLNNMYEFGIVFSFPILVLYLYILIKTALSTVRSDNHNTYSIGYYLLLIPFIVSMAEPTFPFGPGTATVFNFVMFGAALRNTHEILSIPNLSVN